MSMEYPRPDDEKLYRIDIEKIPPAKIFEWARQQYEHKRYQNGDSHNFPSVVEHLANMLENYISTHFQGELPELIIEAKDVFRTADVEPLPQNNNPDHKKSPLSRVIDITPLSEPREGEESLLNFQTIHGRLFGFHRGEVNDLRLYVDEGRPPHHLMGGIYTPLLSIGLTDSNIQLARQTLTDRYESLGRSIVDALEVIGDDEIEDDVNQLMQQLERKNLSTTKRLQESAPLLLHILSIFDPLDAKSQHLIDDLYDMVKLKLDLYSPQEIEVAFHRQVMTKGLVRSHKPVYGTHTFASVTDVQFGLIGESERLSLGLLFIHDTKHIELPVESVVRLNKEDY